MLQVTTLQTASFMVSYTDSLSFHLHIPAYLTVSQLSDMWLHLTYCHFDLQGWGTISNWLRHNWLTVIELHVQGSMMPCLHLCARNKRVLYTHWYVDKEGRQVGHGVTPDVAVEVDSTIASCQWSHWSHVTVQEAVCTLNTRILI